MPGDVLIFGNVGLGFDAEEAAKHLATLKDLLQLAAVVVLQEDIEIAAAQEAPVRIGFEAAGGGQFEIGTPYPKLDKDYYARGRE